MPSRSVARRLTVQLPPGSEEAVKRGCLCPVIDNHYGKGVPWGGKENQYWINGDCPLHGLKVETNIDGLEATEGTAGYTDSR